MTGIIESIREADKELQETKPHICPNCGCDWDVLWECVMSDVGENRAQANVISDNCGACKTEMRKRLELKLKGGTGSRTARGSSQITNT